MRNNNYFQVFIGAAILTAAFYFGINYRSTAKSEPLNSVAELANEDLTLKSPLLPKKETTEATDGQPSENLAQQRAKSSASQLKAPALSIPNLVGEKVAESPIPVEPDFSGLIKENRQRIPIEQSARPPADKISQADITPKSNRNDAIDSFKPLIPPSIESNDLSIITPENSHLDFGNQRSSDRPGNASRRMTAISNRVLGIQPKPVSSFRVHVIRPGDTLHSIAEKYYPSDEYYLDIYVANQDVLTSPINLVTGTTIRIPDLNNRAAAIGQNGSK